MKAFKTGRRLKVFFDGGCRPNPGRIEAAVVVRGATHLFNDLGNGKSSDAEWLALICALELAQMLDLADFQLMGDAAEVIYQANMALSSGRPKHGHAATFLALHAVTPKARVRWIKRQQNLAGIELAARYAR